MPDSADQLLDKEIARRQADDATAQAQYQEQQVSDVFKTRDIDTGKDSTGRAFPLATERNRARGIEGLQPDPTTGQVDPAARNQWAQRAATLPDVENIRKQWKDVDFEANHARAVAKARAEDEKNFGKRYKDVLDFQPDDKGQEADLGTMKSDIDALEKQSKKTTGIFTKEPAPEAIEAQGKLAEKQKEYASILQQRARIKANKETAETIAADAENRAFDAQERVLGASRASWKQAAADASVKARSTGADPIDPQATSDKMDEAQGEIFTAFNLDRGGKKTPQIYNGQVFRPDDKAAPTPEGYHRIVQGNPDGSSIVTDYPIEALTTPPASPDETPASIRSTAVAATANNYAAQTGLTPDEAHALEVDHLAKAGVQAIDKKPIADAVQAAGGEQGIEKARFSESALWNARMLQEFDRELRDPNTTDSRRKELLDMSATAATDFAHKVAMAAQMNPEALQRIGVTPEQAQGLSDAVLGLRSRPDMTGGFLPSQPIAPDGTIAGDNLKPQAAIFTGAQLVRMKKKLAGIDADLGSDNLTDKLREPLVSQRKLLNEQINQGMAALPSDGLRQQVTDLTRDPTKMEYVKNFVGRVGEGMGSTSVDAIEFVARNATKLVQLATPDDSALAESEGNFQGFIKDMAQGMREESQSWGLKGVPAHVADELANSFSGSIGQGIGSTLAFIAPTSIVGKLGKLAGLGEKTIGRLMLATVGAAGAATEANNFRRDAGTYLDADLKAGKITQEEHDRSLGMAELFGGIMGSTEMMTGIGRMTQRIGAGPVGKSFLRKLFDVAGKEGGEGAAKWLRGPGAKAAIDVASEMMEESVQEFGQNVGENTFAQKTFDKDRAIFPDASDAAGSAAISTLIVSSLTQALHLPGLTKRYKTLGKAVNEGRTGSRESNPFTNSIEVENPDVAGEKVKVTLNGPTPEAAAKKVYDLFGDVQIPEDGKITPEIQRTMFQKAKAWQDAQGSIAQAETPPATPSPSAAEPVPAAGTATNNPQPGQPAPSTEGESTKPADPFTPAPADKSLSASPTSKPVSGAGTETPTSVQGILDESEKRVGFKGNTKAKLAVAKVMTLFRRALPEEFGDMRVHFATADQMPAGHKDSTGVFAAGTNELFVNTDHPDNKNDPQWLANVLIHESTHFADRFGIPPEVSQRAWSSLTHEERVSSLKQYDPTLTDEQIAARGDLVNDRAARAEWVSSRIVSVMKGEVEGLDSGFIAKAREYIAKIRDIFSPLLEQKFGRKLDTDELDKAIVGILEKGNTAQEETGGEKETPQAPPKQEAPKAEAPKPAVNANREKLRKQLVQTGQIEAGPDILFVDESEDADGNTEYKLTRQDTHGHTKGSKRFATEAEAHNAALDIAEAAGTQGGQGETAPAAEAKPVATPREQITAGRKVRVEYTTPGVKPFEGVVQEVRPNGSMSVKLDNGSLKNIGARDDVKFSAYGEAPKVETKPAAPAPEPAGLPANFADLPLEEQAQHMQKLFEAKPEDPFNVQAMRQRPEKDRIGNLEPAKKAAIYTFAQGLAKNPDINTTSAIRAFLKTHAPALEPYTRAVANTVDTFKEIRDDEQIGENKADATAPAGIRPEDTVGRFQDRGEADFVKGASGQKHPVVYVAADHDDIISSATGFPPVANPKYPLRNTRDYSQGAEREKLISNLRNFDPSEFANAGTGISQGAPAIASIIREDGSKVLATIGGNNRHYLITHSRQSDRANVAAAYGQHSGYTGVSNLTKNKGLYRYLGEFDMRDPAQAKHIQALVADLNPSAGQVQDTLNLALQFSSNEKMPAAVGKFASTPDAFAKLFDGKASKALLARLVDQGVIDGSRTRQLAEEQPEVLARFLVTLAQRYGFADEAAVKVIANELGSTERNLADSVTPLAVKSQTIPGMESLGKAFGEFFKNIAAAKGMKVNDTDENSRPITRNARIDEIITRAAHETTQSGLFTGEASALARVVERIATSSLVGANDEKGKFNYRLYGANVDAAVELLNAVLNDRTSGQQNIFESSDEQKIADTLTEKVDALAQRRAPKQRELSELTKKAEVAGDNLLNLAAPTSPAARLATLRKMLREGKTLTEEQHAEIEALDKYVGQQFANFYDETKAEEERIAEATRQAGERGWWSDTATVKPREETRDPKIGNGQMDLFSAPAKKTDSPDQAKIFEDEETEDDTPSTDEEKKERTFTPTRAFRISDGQSQLNLDGGKTRPKVGTSTREIKIARETIMPDAAKVADMVPADIAKNLSEHQRVGANLAINSLFGDDYGGFYNADGTGAGKTRQALAVAEYARRQGKKVLIVTQSDAIISDAFLRDTEVMGLGNHVWRWGGSQADLDADAGSQEHRVYIDTYTSFSKGSVKPGQFDLIVLDEAHNLKNPTMSARGQAGLAITTADDTKVAFFTATGLDKFQHLQYLRKLFPEYDSIQELAEAAGVRFQIVKGKDGKSEIRETLHQGKTEDDIAEFIDGLFSRLTARGQMVKREVAMDNLTFDFTKVPLPDSAFIEAENVYWSEFQRAAQWPLYQQGIAMQAARRVIEAHKLPAIVEGAMKAISQGKQVVIFSDRIGDKDGSLGTLDRVREELEKRLGERDGRSRVGTFYGPNKRQGTIDAFQRGDLDVMVATPKSGGVGISLDDIHGDRPRHLIIATPPFSAMDIVQIIGRINRLGTASPATAQQILTDSFVDTWGIDIVASKIANLGGAVGGDITGIKVNDDRAEELDAAGVARYLGHYISSRMALPPAKDSADSREGRLAQALAQRNTYQDDITPNLQEAVWQIMGSDNQRQLTDGFLKVLQHSDPRVSEGAWALYRTLVGREESRERSYRTAEIWERFIDGTLMKTDAGRIAFNEAMGGGTKTSMENVERAYYESRDADAWALANDADAFRNLSDAHANLEDGLQLWIKAQAMTEESAKLIRSIYALVDNPRYLNNISFYLLDPDDSALGRGGASAVGLRTRMAKNGREQTNIHMLSAAVALHEIGHAAYFGFLTADQRRQVNMVYSKLGGRVNGKQWFRKGSPYEHATQYSRLTPNDQYFSKNVFEFFAQSFAEYILDKKAPPSALRHIYERVRSDIPTWLQKLRRRGAPEGLAAVYDNALEANAVNPIINSGPTRITTGVDYGSESVNYGDDTVERRTALVRWLGGAPSEFGNPEQWVNAYKKAMGDINNENGIDAANWRQRARKYATMLGSGAGLDANQFINKFDLSRQEVRQRSGVQTLVMLNDGQFQRLWGITKDEYKKMTGLDEGDAPAMPPTPPPGTRGPDGVISLPESQKDGANQGDLFGAPRRAAPGVTSPQEKDPTLREDIASTIGSLEDNRPLLTRLNDWWRQLRAEGKRRFIQGALDSFHAIKDLEQKVTGEKKTDASKSAYEAALRTKNLSGVMDVVMRHGMVEYVNGGVQIRKGSKAIGEILRPVISDGEDMTQAFEFYIASKRASRLKGEGREQNFDAAKIQKGLSLADTKLSNGKTFEEVRQEYATWNSQLLDFAEQAGLINKEQRATWEHSDYVPFYRLLNDDTTRNNKLKQGLAGQSAGIKLLTGAKGRVAPIENIMLNAQHMIDAGLKNIAMRRVADLIRQDQTVGEEMPGSLPPLTDRQLDQALRAAGMDPAEVPDALRKSLAQELADRNLPNRANIIAVKEGGKTTRFRIDDDLLMRAITQMGADRHTVAMRVFGVPRKILTRAVTLDPGFMVRNAVRDSVAAWVISDAKLRPVIDSIKGFASSLKEDPATLAIIAGGGGTGGFYSLNPASMRKQLRNLAKPKDRAELLRRLKTIQGFKHTIIDGPEMLWNYYRALGEASEMANRVAFYKGTIREGGTQAEAVARANDLLNFSMHGDWTVVKFLTNAVPFMNARVQGLYRLARAADIETNPAKALATRRLMAAKVFMHGAQIMLASLALYGLNRDDDRYQQLEEWDKDNYFHFFLDKLFPKAVLDAAKIDPKFYHIRLPKPFEVGLVFGTAPERIAARLAGDINNRDLAKSFWYNVGQTLNFNPTPQIIKPGMDVYANKDSFTGRPIINMSDQKLAPAAQYSATTSATARALGQAFNWSPKQIEALTKGYFGTLGLYAMSASDMIVRSAMGYPEPPAKSIARAPVIGSFLRGDDPANTKYITEFYEAFQASEELNATIKAYRSRGDFAHARELQENADRENITMASRLRKTSDELAALRKQEQHILGSSLSADDKKARLDAISLKKNALAKATVTQYRRLGDAFRR